VPSADYGRVLYAYRRRTFESDGDQDADGCDYDAKPTVVKVTPAWSVSRTPFIEASEFPASSQGLCRLIIPVLLTLAKTLLGLHSLPKLRILRQYARDTFLSGCHWHTRGLRLRT
jgi:hypothetical protein